MEANEEVLETDEETIETIKCKVCDGGVMSRAIIKPYNVNAAIALCVIGFLCLVSGVLSIIGLIMLMVGVYFFLAKKEVWVCDKCKALVERL